MYAIYKGFGNKCSSTLLRMIVFEVASDFETCNQATKLYI